MRILTILVALFSASLLTGCLVDSPKRASSATVQKPDDDPHYFSITGRVVKGVVSNAKVSLHVLSDGAFSELSVVESTTDSRGFYELRIPAEFVGHPALITANLSESLMVCDLLDGCQDIPFGGKVIIDESSLNLHVGIPELYKSGLYNISILTTLGYLIAESDPYGRPIESRLTNAEMKVRLAKANSSVASLFGIVGDIASHEIIDFTDVEERNLASDAAVRYSVLNSAVLEAALSAYQEREYSGAIARLVSQLAGLGMAGNTSSGYGEVTLEAVIDRLIQAYSRLQNNGSDYSGQLSELYAVWGLYVNEPPGRYIRGVPSLSSNLTSLEKSKKMVESVRGVALSLDLRKLVELSNLSKFVSGGVGDALEGFGVVLDASQVLAGDNADRTMSALVSVLNITLEALLKYYQDGIVPAEIDGVQLSHGYRNGEHSIAFYNKVNGCSQEQPCWIPIDLTITLRIGAFGGSGVAQMLIIEDMSANIIGTLGDDHYRIFFPGVSSFVKWKNLKLRKGKNDFEGQTFLDMEDWTLNVSFNVQSNIQEDPVSLEGLLNTSGQKLVAILKDSESRSSIEQGLEIVRTDTVELYELKQFLLNLSFSINEASEDSFYAALNVSQKNSFSGKAVYTNILRRLCSESGGPDCQQTGEESRVEGESIESFVGLSASVAYKANLKSVAEPVLIQISGSRESPTVNKITNLKVSYPGHAVSLNGRFSNSGGITALDAKNLDGMHLYFDAINGKRTGAIETPFKEKVADITDMGQWVKVRYINGEFESL